MKKNKCKCLDEICNKCLIKKKTKKNKTKKPLINPIINSDRFTNPIIYRPQVIDNKPRDLTDLLLKLLNKSDKKPVNTISTQTQTTEIVDDLITFDYLTDISPIVVPKKSNVIETQTDDDYDSDFMGSFEKEYTRTARSPFLRTDSESDLPSFKPSSLLNKVDYQASVPFYSELYSSGSNKFIDKPLIFEESDEKYKGYNPPFIQPSEPPKKISRGQLKETVIFEGEPKIEPVVEKKFTKPKVYKKKNPIIEEEAEKRNVMVEEEGIFEQLPESIFEQVPESSFKPTIKNPNQAKYYKEKSDIIGKKQSDKYKNSTAEEQALIRKKWNEQVQKRRDELLTPEERVIKEAKREAKILKQEQYIMNLEDEQSKKIQHHKKEIELMSKEDKRKKFKELKPDPLFENIIAELKIKELKPDSLFENIIAEPKIKKTTKKTSKISLNRKNLKDTLVEKEMTKYDKLYPKKRGKPSNKSMNDRENYKFAIIAGLENATTEELKQMLLK